MSSTADQSLYWFVASYSIAQIANCLLLYKINKQKNVYGVSIDSQIALLVATLARPIWFFDTKLPTLWSANIELAIGFCLHAVIVYFCVKHKDAL